MAGAHGEEQGSVTTLVGVVREALTMRGDSLSWP